MASDGRLPHGLPLLSGPPSSPTDSSRAEISCRKCNKEFNIIFTRQKKCNHCGYSYCSSCVDYQALMPRGGTESGYVPMPVCAFCIEFLNITAAARGQLKSLPLSKLKRYVDAYNIKVDRAVEKDDLIDAIVAARCQNGCLSYANEEFYRKYSIPNRSNISRPRTLFNRTGLGSHHPPRQPPPPPPDRSPEYNFPRPDLAPDHQMPPGQEQPTQSHYSPPPGPPPRPPPPPSQNRHSSAPPRPSSQNRQSSAPPRPPAQPHFRYSPSPPPPPPRPPPPGQRHQWSASPPVPPTPEPFYHYTPTPEPPPPRPPPPPSQRHQSPPVPPFPQPQHHDRNTPSHQFPSQESRQWQSANNVNVPDPTNSNAAANSRPQSTSASPTPSSLSLDELLLMSLPAISALPISTLKTILFTNHVNAGMILEKGELVVKVNALVEEERRTRERQRLAEEREEQEVLERQREMFAEHEREKRQKGEKQEVEQNEGSGSESAQSEPRGKAATLERTGLCVICQDEEANIAIVDCGHLAMCRGCSDMVMASSRECPLCRTRIVTEARLLRIFKS